MTVKKIESRDNPRLKQVRKVRDGHEPELIYVEGLRLSEEAFISDLTITRCFSSSAFGDTDGHRAFLSSVSLRCDEMFEVPDRLFSSIADTRNAQGILLICVRPKSDLRSFEQKIKINGESLPHVVMLTEVNNPSNLGAVIRTAEAAGAAGVIVSRNSADAFSARALRSAMGSAFRLPIWQDANTIAAFEWARNRGLIIRAASGNGDSDHTAVDWTQPSVIVFGSEAHGLSEDVAGKADQTVRIPMNKTVESLNLAVSAGVILFEARRQNPKLAVHE